MSLGERLLEARLEKGHTKTEAGRLLGVTRWAYAEWEADGKRPRDTHWMKIANYAGMSLAELKTMLGGKPDAA